MLKTFAGRLSYANVMATVAVFIAIGGGAYAAGLAKDSVGSKQIKAGAVKSADLKDGGIATVDIKAGAVTGGSVADGSLEGIDIDEASLGSTLRVTYALNAGNCSVAEGTQGSCVATCPEGLRPIAGAAYSESNFEEQLELNASGFDTAPDPTGWQAWFDNNADLGGADGENSVTVIAACAPVESQTTVDVNG